MGKLLRCRNSSNSINDITVDNNEAIATILINTRVIGQQAGPYDISINTLVHEFTLKTTSIFTDIYIQVIFKANEENITNKIICGSNKRKSFVLYQMTRSVILYTGLLMIRLKYNVDNFQTNPKVNDVYLVFGR